MPNALSLEERRRARLDRSAMRSFEQMDRDGKGRIYREEKRWRSIDDTLRRLRESRDQLRADVFLGHREKRTCHLC